MHIKFLARGTGSAAAAAAYLLGDRDAAGKERVAVEVLRGDPQEVAAVADALDFKHRYTSGLIAWSAEDAPSPAEIDRVLDEFEKSAWTGLAPERYAWSAILHRDREGGAHVHVFAARCDLGTGRSLNIAPPGWEKAFDPLRDAFNYERGWRRPDDPTRMRAYRPTPPRGRRSVAGPPRGDWDVSTLLAGLQVEPDPRVVIGEYLLGRVSEGEASDRAGVVAALEEAGLEVTRQGQRYVTARHPETGDRWRLKGGLYEKDFDRERFMRRQGPEPPGGRELADSEEDASRASAQAWESVKEMRLRRADYHRERYGVQRGRGPAELPPPLGLELDEDALTREPGPAIGGGGAGDGVSAGERGDAGGVAAVERVKPKHEIEWLLMSHELDRREERVIAGTGDGRLLADAAEELAESGATFGDGGLTERAQIIGRAEGRLEEDLAEVELEEADLLEDAAGEELLRNARLEVLGAADREAQTLTDRAAVIAQAVKAKLEADRKWEAQWQARFQTLGSHSGGTDLYHAHLADLDPKWGVDGNTTPPRGNRDAALRAAESDAPRLERLRAVLSDEAAAARYREVLGEAAGQFKTPDLDGALASGEREREEREAAQRRAAALETATEAAQAAAARSQVELPGAYLRAIYETGETHAGGLAAVARTTQALAAAADQRLPADTIIDTWNATRSDPGGIAAALDAATAAARREEERAAAAAAQRQRQAVVDKRLSRLEQLFDAPASGEAFIAALDGEDPSWRTGTRPACIDRALDVAERGLGRRQATAWRHQLVLEAEQQFPGAPSAAWGDAGGGFKGRTAPDRHARSVSRMLSDRACARALAAEKPELPPSRNLVQRLYEWLRTRIEKLFGLSPARVEAAAARRPEASAERPAEAGRPQPTAFEERYCRKWPEHAADIHRPDFEEKVAAAVASDRNKLFERQEPWTKATPGELPAALARPAPAWDAKTIERVTWLATPGVGNPERTRSRQTVDAHLSDYEHGLPEQYSQAWRAIRERAERAVMDLQDTWRYKRADRRKDDRKKRELEAAAINRACGRDARRLHKEMMAAREAARPEWEVTVRIRAVQQLIRNEEEDRRFQEGQERAARERERAADRPPPERRRTRDDGHGRDR